MRKSKYAFLGAIRSRSQRISFEIIFSLCFIRLAIFVKSFELNIFINFFNLIFFSFFVIIILVELNRAPFDFSEGESELVSGFNVEYRRFSFALLFLAEYGSLLFFSGLLSFIFFNGNLVLIYLVFRIILLIRSAFPRFRYDFLINIFWFKLLPFRVLYFFFYFCINNLKMLS
jgi:NADH-ubiquinone oxidoreductase chain 1